MLSAFRHLASPLSYTLPKGICTFFGTISSRLEQCSFDVVVCSEVPQIFSTRRAQAQKETEELTASLYQQIGQLQVELDWMKKNLDLAVGDKRRLIEPEQGKISLARQCELVGLARSSWYYSPVEIDPYELHLMNLIDTQYTATPFYGIRRMTAWLATQGEVVNHKRVARLMRRMRIEAIYARPKTRCPADNVRRYPYLLKGMKIEEPNQVWSTDITYLRLPHGFVYLVAILDWYSRYVLAWEVSNTMEVSFCLEALKAALRMGKPEMFNSDQGAQFTSVAFTGYLEKENISISQDGKGRAFDNIFIERLWRTVKYEEVYLKDYSNVPIALKSLSEYFEFYNHQRLHQSLGYQTPAAVHFSNRG